MDDAGRPLSSEKTPEGVFLSYSSHDRVIATKLKAALESNGVVVRIDRETIRPNQPIRDFILESIRSTTATIWLVSENSLASTWVGEEIFITLADRALWQNRKLIPCRLDDAFLRDDFTERVSKAIQDQIAVLKQQAERDPSRPTPELDARKNDLLGLVGRLGDLVLHLRSCHCVDLTSTGCLREIGFGLGVPMPGAPFLSLFENGDISARRDEIYALVGADQLERALKRVMDLVREFSRGQPAIQHQQEAARISLRHHGAKAIKGPKARADAMEELADRLFKLVEKVISESSGAAA